MKRILLSILVLVCPLVGMAREPMHLVSTPSLSPDGKTVVFSWRGDIWSVPVEGGVAEQLTSHSRRDGKPLFSPNGKEIAFNSDRSGSLQLFVMSAEGGAPRQITYHSEGCQLQEWFPDGQSFLILGQRDHFWRQSQRFFRVKKEKRAAEELIFNGYGENGSLSPDGQKLLYTREGERWWRKGYTGSRASQIWMYDLANKKHQKILARETESRSPLWKPDGSGFYYVGAQSGSLNLWEHDLGSGKEKQLTSFEDDSVVSPSLSKDGSTLVFRHLFDLYRLSTQGEKTPQKVQIYYEGDSYRDEELRRTLTRATEVAFSDDGLEIAFIAGGDLWVMDTELREPVQITKTAEEEHSPLFSPDNNFILFVSDQKGQSDIWKATRGDTEKYWWQNRKFKLEQLTQDADIEHDLKWSPNGKLVGFIKGRGNLWTMKPDGKDAKQVIQSWDPPDYAFSPDGKWIVYAISDNDFNNDIWLMPLDNSRKPFNLSRHPDNEYSPAWSPDGKVIAFTSRVGTETDIYFVYLQKDSEEKTARDRKLEAALKKMKGRKKPSAGTKKPEKKPEGEKEEKKPEEKKEVKPEEKKPKETIIDFDGIHDRIHRVNIANAAERGLFWSHDSKKIGFTATINSKRGTYTVELPAKLTPKLLGTTVGTNPRWIASGNRILWLANGIPASTTATGATSSYAFSVLQAIPMADRYKATFDVAWRLMRDNWYDGNFNNRNWDEIRRKYSSMAAQSCDMSMLSRIISMMLGELNGSHLGFYASTSLASLFGQRSRETTGHLGSRFEPGYKGPGWKVKDVIPGSPASQQRSRLEPGDVIVSVNEKTVDPGMDITEVLNAYRTKELHLKVKNGKSEARDVTIQPISYSRARSLLYEAWIRNNRKIVDEKSGGKLGYLHIAAMNQSSFLRFEKELYHAGAGKDGLIIDVRENGGGSTTDHLLTALTQPVHAITVPRGGGRGYPQDRKIYASWSKPIAVLCNQNSFSNAEIFSHAIKGLKRGQVIGVPTAGGVISTGAARVMDVGRIRIPFRGWYVASTGEDMELNGAVPHHIVWPEPEQLPAGIDKQLDKAVDVLAADVKEWQARPKVKLIKASERRK